MCGVCKYLTCVLAVYYVLTGRCYITFIIKRLIYYSTEFYLLYFANIVYTYRP